MSVAVLVFMLPTKIFAETGLENCADQFPESSVLNAPTTATTTPDHPAPGNAHVCKRKNENSFFAMEYDTSRFTAAWVGDYARSLSICFRPKLGEGHHVNSSKFQQNLKIFWNDEN